MKSNLKVLTLSSALILSMGMSTFAAEVTTTDLQVPTVTSDTLASQSLADSILYYGQVQSIIKDDNGNITKIKLGSEKYGDYIFNVSEQTYWIDSANHSIIGSNDLQEGEGIYVFHSPISTRSLPPQSAAFAIVRNIPQDATVAEYHEIESIKPADGKVVITTDNGDLTFVVDENTAFSSYNSKEAVKPNDFKVGSHIMTWSTELTKDGQTVEYADHMMLLDQGSGDTVVIPRDETAVTDPDITIDLLDTDNTVAVTDEALTRGSLVEMLYEVAGNPAVDNVVNYNDVNADSPYLNAISWATNENIVSGYTNGDFGVNDTLTREQFMTILWRAEGSPMLMDYPGLTKYTDASDISSYARQAMAWADQKGYLVSIENNQLSPQGIVTVEQAQNVIDLAIAE